MVIFLERKMKNREVGKRRPNKILKPLRERIIPNISTHFRSFLTPKREKVSSGSQRKITWFLVCERISMLSCSPTTVEVLADQSPMPDSLWVLGGKPCKVLKALPYLAEPRPQLSHPQGLTFSALTQVLDTTKLRPNLRLAVFVAMRLPASHLTCVPWFSHL